MTAAFASARHLLTAAAEDLSRPVPERIPLRLDHRRAVLRSALPRLLAAETGEDPARLAAALAAAAAPGEPFSSVTACGSMVELALSPAWMRRVLRRWAQRDWTPPAVPAGVRPCDREDPAFLLWYTARRCHRADGDVTGPLPAPVVCLLAEDAPEALTVARQYWALPPALRRDGMLTRAVGAASAAYSE